MISGYFSADEPTGERNLNLINMGVVMNKFNTFNYTISGYDSDYRQLYSRLIQFDRNELGYCPLTNQSVVLGKKGHLAYAI